MDSLLFMDFIGKVEQHMEMYINLNIFYRVVCRICVNQQIEYPQKYNFPQNHENLWTHTIYSNDYQPQGPRSHQ